MDYSKAAQLFRDGSVGVIPTDTIYGICASALNRAAVERVYELRKRNQGKSMIILIGSLDDLITFGIRLTQQQESIVNQVWPGKVSIIFSCPDEEDIFEYLHRGTRTLAFRLPQESSLREMLTLSGPLIAPSANIEGERPAETTAEAFRYFGESIFYFDRGRLVGEGSTLIDLHAEPTILRVGADHDKVQKALGLHK